MRPLVKICGITNYEDAALALELGADFIGFVMAPSPRRVEAASVAAIVARLKDRGLLARARTVGVFVNQEPSLMASIMAEASLDEAQIHGDEGLAFCEALPFPWYRALRVADVADALRLAGLWAGSSSGRLLFEAASGRAYGGTGVQVDAEAARAALLACRRTGKQFFLAGGLAPGNVGSAILSLGPDGIDASSGLEDSPGRKSAEALRRFFAAIAAASGGR